MAAVLPQVPVKINPFDSVIPKLQAGLGGGESSLTFRVSAVLSKIGDRVPYELGPYKPRLDALYDAFGPDRLLFGSDWPNSDPLGNYAQVLQVVREYFDAKGPAVAEKYFWKNSVAAYSWVHREKGQPGK